MILKSSFAQLANLGSVLDSARYNYRGVHLVCTARGLVATATDGHRLVSLTYPEAVGHEPDAYPLDVPVIIPAADWRRICELGNGGYVHLGLEVTPAFFRLTCATPHKEGELTGRTLTLTYLRSEQGKFPDFAKLVPSGSPEPVQRLKIGARQLAELLSAVADAVAVCEYDYPLVEVLFYGDERVGVTARLDDGVGAEAVFTKVEVEG